MPTHQIEFGIRRFLDDALLNLDSFSSRILSLDIVASGAMSFGVAPKATYVPESYLLMGVIMGGNSREEGIGEIKEEVRNVSLNLLQKKTRLL